MGTTARMHVLRYGSAALVIALATGLRLLLDPVLGDRFAFITFFFAVVLVAWLWGLGPSLAALVLSWLSAAYFILPPRGTLWVQGVDNQIGLVLFFLAGLAVALLSGSLRTAQQRAQGAEEAERGQRQQLQVTLQFHQAVMANMGEGLYAVDTQGLVTYMNPAAESLFGWTSAELLGRKMHDLTHYRHPDGRPFPVEECAGFRVLHEGQALKDYDDVFIRKDGTFFPVVYSSSPLISEGKVAGLVVVFRDVTERKRTDEALRPQRE